MNIFKKMFKSKNPDSKRYKRDMAQHLDGVLFLVRQNFTEKEAVARGQNRQDEIFSQANAEARAILDKAAADIAQDVVAGGFTPCGGA